MADTAGKPALQSTQNWMNVLGTALVTQVPFLQTFASAHPSFTIGVFAVANILWRTFITKQPIHGIY